MLRVPPVRLSSCESCEYDKLTRKKSADFELIHELDFDRVIETVQSADDLLSDGFSQSFVDSRDECVRGWAVQKGQRQLLLNNPLDETPVRIVIRILR